MYVHFWGTRGSLPYSLTADKVAMKLKEAFRESLKYNLQNNADIEDFIQNKLPFAVRGTYGGNTPCVEIRDGDRMMICDAGSGLRDLGTDLVKRRQDGDYTVPTTFYLFLSHLHWDHIQGFPFFPQAFVPGNQIIIHSFHPEMEKSFERQQNPLNFPVPLSQMQADIRFVLLNQKNQYDINGFKIRVIPQNHPGDSFGFCFERNGKKVIYSTDAEHRQGAETEKDYPFLDFFREADLLIFDAQYALVDAIDTKKNWGHSSNLLAVELAVRSNVKRLCLFHNEHTSDDKDLDRFLADTKNYLSVYSKDNSLRIMLAYDGLRVEL